MNFAKRYEPTCWNELVFADPAIEQELRQYVEGRSYNHILLTGPYGCGKTTTAKVMIASSYGSSVPDAFVEAVEICDDIEDRLDSFMRGHGWGHAMMANKNTTKPYVILNEVHKYTPRQQLTLRGIMDKRSVGRFVMTANDTATIDPGVLDRCDPFELTLPPPSAWAIRAQQICAAESVSADLNDLETLILEYGGSVRGTLRAIEKTLL